MATRILFHSLPPAVLHGARSGSWIVLRSLALLIGLLLSCIPARSQHQQAFVFATDATNPKSIDVYTRNDLTGVLTPVPGSPFPSKEPVNVVTLDFQGRFLFTASDNPGSSGSPFASSFTNQPVFLSTESSGQFLYVINFNSSQSQASAVESFRSPSTQLVLANAPPI
jgi:6-phosphogluconolactonase (cycloisomerase 2 family)